MNYTELKAIDDERTIAVVFLIISSYTLIESYSFAEEAARWPRYISIIAIFGCILILAQEKLPALIKAIVKEDDQILDRNEDFSEKTDTGEMDGEFSTEHAVFTAISVIGFGILILSVGYVVATVLFLITFSYYFDIDYKITLAFIVVSLSIIFIVGNGLNIPIYEGLLDIIGWFYD